MNWLIVVQHWDGSWRVVDVKTGKDVLWTWSHKEARQRAGRDND